MDSSVSLTPAVAVNEKTFHGLITCARNDAGNHFALNKHVNTVVNNLPTIGGQAELDVLEQQFNIIDEEVSEALAELDQDNSPTLQELRDGLGDILVTYDGALVRLGLEPVDFQDLTDVRLDGTAEERRTDPLVQSRGHFNIGRTHSLVREVVLNARRNGSYNREHLRHLIVAVMAATHEVIHLIGADVIDDQHKIFLSNMSKFDTDLATAEKGVAKYKEMGVKARIEETRIGEVTYHVLKVAEHAEVGNKKFVPGKFLKGINFFEPVFGPLAVRSDADEAASA